MPVINTAREFSSALTSQRANNRSVGLVPTMGALHAGHRSLIERAARECDVVAVTVFVNPLQFDDPADLDAYPKDLPADAALAFDAGAALLFAPPVSEMYPGYPAPVPTVVYVHGLCDRLEGACRPGHFGGVCTVVTKLFAIAGRCRAYFGDKDFQQLAIVRRLAADLSLPVEIVGCPTVREPDGLALSSRNSRLSPAGRAAAGALHRALDAGLSTVRQGALDRRGAPDSALVRSAMWDVMAGEPLVEPDYAEVVHARSLEPPEELRGDLRLLVAASVEGVRLIDNEGIVVERSEFRKESGGESANPKESGGEPANRQGSGGEEEGALEQCGAA